MIRKILATTIIAGASLSFVAAAQAQSDFDAKPMNSGPPMMMMPGMQPAPAAEPMANKPMMMKKKMSKKMMMKKKMMKKEM